MHLSRQCPALSLDVNLAFRLDPETCILNFMDINDQTFIAMPGIGCSQPLNSGAERHAFWCESCFLAIQ